MKNIKRWVPVLAMTFLCGCFQVQDDLTLLPDGSGTVKMVVTTSLPQEFAGMLSLSGRMGGGAAIYPPASEAEARQIFPAKDFTLKTEEKSPDTGKTLVIEAAFKNVNALLASPYGRAHQLALTTNGAGVLQLRTLSGGSLLARTAQARPEGEMADVETPGLEEAQKKKGEMSFQFSVHLPAAVTAANGEHSGDTVTWKVQRAQCKDDEEFADRLSGVWEASCSAAGLRFTPLTPARLGLVPFNQLVAGQTASTVSLPDTNKIAAAARFIPCTLQVQRSLDLTGEGSAGRSQAILTGAFLLPAELVPQRWGKIKLEEAVDAAGNSLVPKENDNSIVGRFTSMGRFGNEDADTEGEDSGAAPKASEPKPRIVTLTFNAPEWKVKRIARVRGLLDLQYLGASEVIKVSNAVPASVVMDMSKRTSYSFSSDSERGLLSDARLAELGLNVRVQTAMVQSGMTMLSLETSTGKSTLVDAQVFDADGKPWPTTLTHQDFGGREEQMAQVMVAGKPKPPFSLALEVGGIGASVNVPILVENMPVADK